MILSCQSSMFKEQHWMHCSTLEGKKLNCCHYCITPQLLTNVWMSEFSCFCCCIFWFIFSVDHFDLFSTKKTLFTVCLKCCLEDFQIASHPGMLRNLFCFVLLFPNSDDKCKLTVTISVGVTDQCDVIYLIISLFCSSLSGPHLSHWSKWASWRSASPLPVQRGQ